MTIIESYLPKKISTDELMQIVRGVVTELSATSQKDMGRVMKAAMEKTKGRADGKEVQMAVKTALGA